jgi:hypothetical protein
MTNNILTTPMKFELNNNELVMALPNINVYRLKELLEQDEYDEKYTYSGFINQTTVTPKIIIIDGFEYTQNISKHTFIGISKSLKKLTGDDFNKYYIVIKTLEEKINQYLPIMFEEEKVKKEQVVEVVEEVVQVAEVAEVVEDVIAYEDLFIKYNIDKNDIEQWGTPEWKKITLSMLRKYSFKQLVKIALLHAPYVKPDGLSKEELLEKLEEERTFHASNKWY